MRRVIASKSGMLRISMPRIFALFTLIMGKAARVVLEKRRKSARGKEKLTMAGRASSEQSLRGLTILPSPAPSPNSNVAGRQAIAARIAELAQAHDMKLSNTADLASLLDAIQVNDPIPIEAFAVVAEVLFAVLNGNQQPHNREAAAP